MALPSISDLKLWVGTLLTKNEWDYNFTKIANWFSDGSADLVVNSVKAENGIDLDGARLTNVGAATSGTDAVNLDTAQSLLNQTSYYDLFTVASGKEDSSGNSAFLQKDSDTQVTVLAGNTNPDLVLCQSDGTVETLTSNTVLTVAAGDGIYNIVKEKGQTPVITSGKVTIGKVLPTSDITAGDYFLDNSSIPFKAYKYDAQDGWVETPFCLLGTVVKTSGTVTAYPVQFDDNGYNYNAHNLILAFDYTHGIPLTNGTTYTASQEGIVSIKGQRQGSVGLQVEVYVDGTLISQYFDSNNDQKGAVLWAYVAKGQTYKVICNTTPDYSYFYPMKGA